MGRRQDIIFRRPQYVDRGHSQDVRMRLDFAEWVNAKMENLPEEKNFDIEVFAKFCFSQGQIYFYRNKLLQFIFQRYLG